MGKPLRLLNLTLGLVALLIVGALAKTWVAPAASTPGPTVAKPSQEPITVVFNRPARPPLAQFDSLLEKNPFKQPPPAPVRPNRPGPPPPPPLPLPVLVGTILVDDDRRAILSDKGKSDIYQIGQGVAGGTLTAISEDRVLFKRGDTISEIMLKATIQPGTAPRSEAPTPSSISPLPAPSSSAPPVPPQEIQRALSSPEGGLSKEQREQHRESRKQEKARRGGGKDEEE